MELVEDNCGLEHTKASELRLEGIPTILPRMGRAARDEI